MDRNTNRKDINDIEFKLQDMRHLLWARSRRSSGTAGSFLKSYDDSHGQKVYYKLSDYDALSGIVGHECVNEIIAQRLMDLFGIEHLRYRLIHALVKIDGHDYETYMCESDDFKGPYEAKVALEDYYDIRHEDKESPLDMVRRMGWEKAVCDMLFIDFLILNRDRHGANIEVLLNNRDKSVRLAPMFDQGCSFVFRCHDLKDLESFDVMADHKVQAFIGGNSAFDNIALVPKKHLRRYHAITDDDRKIVLAGIDKVLDKAYADRIWEMIMRRWQYVDDLRNT